MRQQKGGGNSEEEAPLKARMLLAGEGNYKWRSGISELGSKVKLMQFCLAEGAGSYTWGVLAQSGEL